MALRHRTSIFVSGVVAVLAMTGDAAAQGRAECSASESGAECHARLKCRADEDLADCQMRLLECSPDESLEDCRQRAGGQRGGSRRDNDGGDRGGGRADDRSDDRGGSRGDDRGGGRDDDRGGSYYGDDDRGRGGGRDNRRARSRRTGGGGGGGAFAANKTFGLGPELGEPSGLNGKYFVSPTLALDFGVGWIYRHYYYDDGLHLYFDFLHHIGLGSADAFEVPLYIGGGIRFWDFDYCFQGVCTYDGTAVGIRIPIGIALDFNTAPVDVFFQVVPVLDFLYGDYYDRNRDRSHFGVDASLGVRFWLD